MWTRHPRTIILAGALAASGVAACATAKIPGASRAACAAADTAPAWREADLDRPTAPMPDNPSARYPDTRPPGLVEGEVVVAFVTDTLGRPEPCSIRVVRATDGAFADAVLKVLPAYRFEPAVRQGRRVRQAWELPFTFTLAR